MASKDVADTSLTNTSDAEQRLKCVSCDKLRPADGKLLHCMHVMCLACLNECMTLGGEIRCVLCYDTPTMGALGGGGVSLQAQLANSQPILYASTTSVADDGAALSSAVDALKLSLECAFCLTDEKRQATHRCLDCDFSPLCSQHAEVHLKLGPGFSQHRVASLALDSPASLTGGSSDVVQVVNVKCLIHPRHEIISYCMECKQLVCEICLAKGHRNHTVTSIAKAAQKMQSKLGKFVRRASDGDCCDGELAQVTSASATPVESTPGSSPALENAIDTLNQDDYDLPPHSSDRLQVTSLLNEATPSVSASEIEELICEASEQVRIVNAEATATSKEVNDLCQRLHERVDNRKAELLAQADRLQWRKLQPLQSRQQRLHTLKQRHDNLLQVTEHLLLTSSSAESTNRSPLTIFQTGEVALENWKTLPQQLDQEKSPFPSIPIAAEVKDECLVTFDETLQGMLVFAKPPVDLNRSKIKAPEEIGCGDSLTVEVELRDSLGDPVTEAHPLPEIDASFVLPSCGSSEAVVTLNNSNPGQLTASVQAQPKLAGPHKVVISAHGQTVCQQVSVVKTSLLFDPGRCHSDIRLEKSSRRAAHKKKQKDRTDCIVLGMPGLAGRCHTWTVAVCGPLSAEDTDTEDTIISLGVCCLPETSDYDSLSESHMSHDSWRGFYWYSFGQAMICDDSTEEARSPRMLNGDSLTFTLRCEEKSLALYNHRTGKKSVMQGVDGKGKPLYFYVCLYGQDSTVEIV